MHRMPCVLLAAALAFAGAATIANVAKAATITVNSTADTAGGAACTLRDAINAANNDQAAGGCTTGGGGVDTIAFRINAATDPGCNATTGVCTFRVGSNLPFITSQVDINGYTQAGASPNTLGGMIYPNAQGTNAQIKIELDGSSYTGGTGLVLNTGSSANRIRGLSIVNFQTAMVLNFGDNHLVTGNFIGVRADGTTAATIGAYGVAVGAFGSYVMVGGLTAPDRNLFGGPIAKVFVNGGNGHSVVGNLIGTDRTGTLPLGAGSDGVYVRGTTGPATNITVQANVIAGNTGGTGVVLLGTQQSAVVDNALGVGVGGGALSNGFGVTVQNNSAAPSGQIRLTRNGIANNTFAGVMVRSTSDGDPSGVFIDGANAIWNNVALGIDLVPLNQNIGQVIPNDPPSALDGDSGPNGLQNYPLISAAAWNNQGGVDLSYGLDSAATRSFTVAAFANPSCDASGNGEGRYPSGSGNVPVTSNASGHVAGTLRVNVPLPAGWVQDAFVTMTATDANSGNTSGFSTCVKITGFPPAMPAAFSFAAQSPVPVATAITSNPITVAGVGSGTTIVVSGGTYSVNGAPATAQPGTVKNGDIVTVQQTSSIFNNRTTTATLVIGLGSAKFDVTTLTGANTVVVEFFNQDLNNFFITADPTEQGFVDSGAVGRWKRTGNTFQAGGPSQVCRFGGNSAINPATGTFYGPNSHVYIADPAECAGLKAIYTTTDKSWKFESNDFAITPAVNGVCPADHLPIYRAYNNGFAKNIDSNHRITGNFAAYQATVASGSIGEGIVMCAERPQGVGNDGGVCIGNYTSTTTLPSCSNKLVASDAIILSGIDISRAGAFQGTGTLANALFMPAPAGDGSCLIAPNTYADAQTPFVGSWNSNSGIVLVGAGSSNPQAGAVTKTADGHLTGTVSSPPGASPSSTVSFDCTFLE